VGHDGGVAAKVLIADDDRAIRDSLRRALTLNGYEVTAVADGVEALATVRHEPQDALVLDVMMPGVDGLGVCRVLRAEGDATPILMLTARVETSDRVAGLDAGADDYLPKPFDLDELLARLRALLRRAAMPVPGGVNAPNGTAGAPGSPGSAAAPGSAGAGGREDDAGLGSGDVRVGALVIDVPGRRARYGDAELTLSKTEFDLLELLARNEGIVLDHSTIYDRIWGYDFGPESKNLAVYVSYLRRKLEAVGGRDLIQTVRGVGYTVRLP
jgi:two-component system, OmpR family, response regulator MprA